MVDWPCSCITQPTNSKQAKIFVSTLLTTFARIGWGGGAYSPATYGSTCKVRPPPNSQFANSHYLCQGSQKTSPVHGIRSLFEKLKVELLRAHNTETFIINISTLISHQCGFKGRNKKKEFPFPRAVCRH